MCILKIHYSYFLTFMTAKIIKTTEKGQITLPKVWRDQFPTDNFLLKIDVHQITIKPVHLNDLEADEEVMFDADRDNKGKGVTPDAMIKLLKKIRPGKFRRTC